VTTLSSSPGLRAPASELRDLTPAPSLKPDAAVLLKHPRAATDHGREADEMSEFPLDR